MQNPSDGVRVMAKKQKDEYAITVGPQDYFVRGGKDTGVLTVNDGSRDILVMSGGLDETGIRSAIMAYNVGTKRGMAIGRNQMRSEFSRFLSMMSNPEPF
jgi:hypothetical protein